jgi:hypothetical protein
VAKAGAQTILISGSDGGTGAAPRTSVHNAGLPWELGLSERTSSWCKTDCVRRSGGNGRKLMTGRDFAIECMLVAEDFALPPRPGLHWLCDVAGLQTRYFPVGSRRKPGTRKRFCGSGHVPISCSISRDSGDYGILGVRSVMCLSDAESAGVRGIFRTRERIGRHVVF